MIPRVAIQYPTAHADVFEPLTDFHVIDAQAYLGMEEDYSEIHKYEKPIWWDISGVFPATQPCIGFDGYILPSFEEPDRNVLSVARWPKSELTTIGIWRGERRHLKLMAEACDIVALPYYEYGRMGYVTPETSHQYHLYEFCSLDELRRYPVRSIHTSVPITAALLGIDLRGRERRPKRLPHFSYGLVLNDAQLELAVSNVMAIREAVYGHYPSEGS